MKKTTVEFNKLIRDKIYQKLLDKNIKIYTKNFSKSENIATYFKKKLKEEAEEVFIAANKEDILEELSDCVEVIREFTKLLGFSVEALEKIRLEKRKKNGGFEQKIVVDKIEMNLNNPSVNYYSQKPEKYKKSGNNLFKEIS